MATEWLSISFAVVPVAFPALQFEPCVAVRAVSVRGVILLAEHVHFVAAVVLQVKSVEALNASPIQTVSKAIVDLCFRPHCGHHAFFVRQSVASVASGALLPLEIELLTQIIYFFAFFII